MTIEISKEKNKRLIESIKRYFAENMDEEIGELNADVVEMEKMIEGYLTFARGEGDEPAVETDISELIETAVAGWRRNGSEIDCHVEGTLMLPVQKDGLRRCIDNLISNADRYGNHIWVRAGVRDEAIEFAVDDDGPGIPEENRQAVFRPFHRLTSHAIRKPAAPVSAWPSHAILHAAMAATSASKSRRMAVCVRGCGCRFSGGAQDRPALEQLMCL